MASKWKKAPEELTRRFNALLPRHPDIEPKKMFGYACAFVRGNFWVGLFEDRVVVRLPEGLHERFPELARAPAFDPMGGRPMKGWFVIPPAVVADDALLGRFFAATFAAVIDLPAKTRAQKKKTDTKGAASREKPAPRRAAAKDKKKAPPKTAAPTRTRRSATA